LECLAPILCRSEGGPWATPGSTRPGTASGAIGQCSPQSHMDITRDTSRQLDETFAQLNSEHLLVIELGDLAHLLMEPRYRTVRPAPLGLVVALLSWVIAYAAAAGATSSDRGLLIALFAVVAAIMLTIAWVVSWMVIETRYFDRRPDGRKASAYELIARCTLEIT